MNNTPPLAKDVEQEIYNLMEKASNNPSNFRRHWEDVIVLVEEQLHTQAQAYAEAVRGMKNKADHSMMCPVYTGGHASWEDPHCDCGTWRVFNQVLKLFEGEGDK